MKITRFGHACLLVEVADRRILVDPGTFSDHQTFTLTNLDVIVITHQHADHVDVKRLPALLAANPAATLLAESQAAEQLAPLGRAWTVIAATGTAASGGVTLTGVGGMHAEILPTIARVGNVGVLIEAAGEPSLFHPGDSYDYSPEGVDVLALPLHAPWAKVAETVSFVKRVDPRTVFPIHDGLLAEVGRGFYWSQVVAHGGVTDARAIGVDESFRC